MYKTKITKQGTITLPAKLRQKYSLQKGETVVIEDNGQITIAKLPSLNELRRKNRQIIKQSMPYKSGDGISAHVKEKYGR